MPQKIGSYTMFSVKVPSFQGMFTPYDPSFYGISWEHIFLLVWGGGVWSKLFSYMFESTAHETGSNMHIW